MSIASLLLGLFKCQREDRRWEYGAKGQLFLVCNACGNPVHALVLDVAGRKRQKVIAAKLREAKRAMVREAEATADNVTPMRRRKA